MRNKNRLHGYKCKVILHLKSHIKTTKIKQLTTKIKQIPTEIKRLTKTYKMKCDGFGNDISDECQKICDIPADSKWWCKSCWQKLCKCPSKISKTSDTDTTSNTTDINTTGATAVSDSTSSVGGKRKIKCKTKRRTRCLKKLRKKSQK